MNVTSNVGNIFGRREISQEEEEIAPEVQNETGDVL